MSVRLIAIGAIALSVAACGPHSQSPADVVTAEERKQVFLECMGAAPVAGGSSVKECSDFAETWVFWTGVERLKAQRGAKL